MARTHADKTETPAQELPVISDTKESDPQDTEAIDEALPEVEESPQVEDPQDVDSILNALKTLLSTVEKLQKVRQEVGDIKPLLVRMLDGELVAEDLEQLKTGVGGLFRLVRAYGDHQSALAKAQPARSLLDEVLKTPNVR
ncbi:hypothetical protein C7B65_17045 [Phormidesmis priestleyi ULC007]|uniref:Uncharacterized protein n=1 Tax=Phormidesmis priestleyi ULC007 TaxID=1920490 RepID=A0A2T1DBS5_9CYAN|nr:hypothetical protein [Phormidesmis priestleyi]PSB17907.1 hypothetical protein C7B65_17045 [Phormidesmis priestleyi ULC007]PZO50040.1 MAG: hypothetical protein DCF14_12960 [Phormidesmis priestleyi]